MRPAALATLVALVAAAPLPAASIREDGEKQIADMTKGRVAGQPTDCIQQYPNNQSYNIDRIGVVYDVGGTRYVMRFQDGCDALDRQAFFSTSTSTQSLCSGDIARVFLHGPPTIFVGTCIIGKFVPYKREG